jgi:hypothetical protein
MYVRLAFAVAAHLEPEILIVDEVLAVGDAAVPEEMPRQDESRPGQSGRTVLFVEPQHGVCKIPGNLLNSGKYSLNLFIVRNENSVIYSKEDMASFDVKDMAQRDTAYLGREPGIVQPSLEWRIEGPLRQ